MKTPTMFVLLALACTTSGYLWWELRTERQAAVSGQQHALAEPEPKSRAPSGEIPVASTQAVDLLSADQRAAASARVELLKDPAYRKARLAQIRADFVRRYAGIAQALGLADIEADQLFDVLAELQLNTNAELNALLAKGMDAEIEREVGARIQEDGGRQRDARLQGLLGSARFAQWQAYQESLPARPEAAHMLQSALNLGGQSISSTHLEPLVTTAAMEQSRYEKEVQQLLRESRASGPEALAQVQVRMLTLREESNQRIIDAAAVRLGPEQVATLRRNFEQQAAVARGRLASYQQRTAP